MTDEIQAKP